MIHGMFAYWFQLFDIQGAVASEHAGLFSSDDAAIEHAGWIDHPHALKVWRSGRSVADFPPVRSPRAAGRDDRRLSRSELQLLRATMIAVADALG
jgi:hypothetical protein